MAAHTKKNTTSGLATWSFNDDTDTGIDSDAANQLDFMVGGTVIESLTASGPAITGALDVSGNILSGGQIYNDSGSHRNVQGYYYASVVSSIAGTTTAGGLFAASNPFGADVLITGFALNVGTAATSATATADFGVGAASNTSYENLMDGAVLTATGTFGNDVDGQGTAGKTFVKWASNHFITGTVASGNVSGLVSSIYVTAIRL